MKKRTGLEIASGIFGVFYYWFVLITNWGYLQTNMFPVFVIAVIFAPVSVYILIKWLRT